MTLSTRNHAFRLVILLSFLCLLLCVLASLKVLPVYSFMEGEISRRAGGIFQAILGHFFDARLLAVHFSIAALVLYSFVSMVFVYYFFEKTQSPEIIFVAFFAASFSLEVLRLVLPIGRVYEIPSMYTLVAARIILFARFFGIFSLFVASLLATGYEVQRQRNVHMLVILAALILALGIPIDSQTWDSSLVMIKGYLPMLRFIDVGVSLITISGFFIATWSRGSSKFVFIGMGAAFALLGRAILLNADMWACLPIGLPFLIAGTLLLCINLHKIYLWL